MAAFATGAAPSILSLVGGKGVSVTHVVAAAPHLVYGAQGIKRNSNMGSFPAPAVTVATAPKSTVFPAAP